jgi:hypothetical protein
MLRNKLFCAEIDVEAFEDTISRVDEGDTICCGVVNYFDLEDFNYSAATWCVRSLHLLEVYIRIMVATS